MDGQRHVRWDHVIFRPGTVGLKRPDELKGRPR
jgi:hypothetical protein